MSAPGPSQTRLSRSLLKDKFQFCWNQEFLGHGFSVQHKVWGRLSPASPNNIRPAAAMPRWQKAKCLQGREGEHGREPNRSSEGHEYLSAPSLLTPQRCSNPNRKSRTLPGLYARFISPPFSQFSFISTPPPPQIPSCVLPFHHSPVTLSRALTAPRHCVHLPLPGTEHHEIFALKQTAFVSSLRRGMRTFSPFAPRFGTAPGY